MELRDFQSEGYFAIFFPSLNPGAEMIQYGKIFGHLTMKISVQQLCPELILNMPRNQIEFREYTGVIIPIIWLKIDYQNSDGIPWECYC